MKYLLIGILSVLTVILSSCGDDQTECLLNAEFIYDNQTDYDISFTTSVIEIQKMSDQSVELNYRHSCSEDIVESIISPIEGGMIVFDDSKCYALGTDEGPTSITNYASVRLSKDHYRFTYVFDGTYYDQADDCSN